MALCLSLSRFRSLVRFSVDGNSIPLLPRRRWRVPLDKGMTFSALLRPKANVNECERLRLSVGSWLASSPHAHVILFADREPFCAEQGLPEAFDRLFGPGRVHYAGPPEVDSKKMALVNKWFETTIWDTMTPYVSMIGSDDIVTREWAESTIAALSSGVVERPVVITPRWDVHANESAFGHLSLDGNDLGRSFASQLEATMESLKMEPHVGDGIEVFSFSLCDPPVNFEKFPPFYAGRWWWDSWFLAWCNKCATTISHGFSRRVYHLDHRTSGPYARDSGTIQNMELSRRLGGWLARSSDVQWIVNGTDYVRGPVPDAQGSLCP
jgi:hypothetical protein